MIRNHKRQRGLSLMEMLIAMSISLVVSLAMVGLMANTLSTGTETIGSARLTSEIRAAMQIMTRDLRRANYHANYIKCFGNVNCRTTLDNGDGDTSAYLTSVSVPSANCFFYFFDRDSDGDATADDPVGAFRRVVVNGVGIIQMTTTRNLAPSCTTGNYWTAITDPDVINVTNFFVSNALSYTDNVDGATQTVDKIALVITAQLTSNAAVQRTVQDVIRVRNDVYAPAP